MFGIVQITLVSSPALVLSLVVGIIEVCLKKLGTVSKYLAFLTFKPVAMTPLWAALLSITGNFTGWHTQHYGTTDRYMSILDGRLNSSLALCILPAMAYTFLVVYFSRKVFKFNPAIGIVLLAMDIIRFLFPNVGLVVAPIQSSGNWLLETLLIAAISITLCFPIVTLIISIAKLGVMRRQKPSVEA